MWGERKRRREREKQRERRKRKKRSCGLAGKRKQERLVLSRSPGSCCGLWALQALERLRWKRENKERESDA